MKKDRKTIYEAPSTKVVEVRHEGVIRGSLGDRGNYDPTDDNPCG